MPEDSASLRIKGLPLCFRALQLRCRALQRQRAGKQAVRYACRRKRPRACKLRHGRERPCLETPLRSESKACPCAAALCNWRCSLSGRASRALCMPALMRPRACKMRHGRERPCLKIPLRSESKACPCAEALCNWRCRALQGAPASAGGQACRTLTEVDPSR